MANASAAAGGARRSVEVSAKTVDEAIARALEQLGCERDEVDVRVLHPGSPGRLLGFGAEPARVRVTLLAGAAPPEEAEVEPEELEREEGPAAPRSGDAELARLMLAELLSRMGLAGVRVEVVGDDPITLNIVGDDVADLIGRRGENLRALQFILSLMLNKQLHRHLRVVVDVDGYRARREELLRSMAFRFAYRVRATREPMQLEAMPPNERRIVHLTLADDPEITTESTGEGDARRVVIKPRTK